MPHSRSLGGSCLPREKEEPSKYYDNKSLRCSRCGEVGHIKRYYRAKESNMTQKVFEVEEDWKNCLVDETQAIDAMVFLNLERDSIEDLEYNIADHVEQQESDVFG